METRKTLQTAVCEAFGITESQLWQETRKREIVDARKCYLYIVNECLETGPSLASQWTGVDRVKIHYYSQKFNDHYRKSKDYRRRADQVLAAFNNKELSLLINI